MKTAIRWDTLQWGRRARFFGAPSVVFALVLLGDLSYSAPRSAGEYTPVFRPELEISRTEGPIKVDGHLEDPGWHGAAKASNFAEHNPGDQTKPAVDTEVWITHDDDNLYVAWLCYDEPKDIRASFCERDQIFSDDYVILCLDPFGDATLAYEISTNPYGVPGDLLFSSSNGEDITYDMIYETAARITESGWVAEMAIPFASLRFPDRAEQRWRVDFWRNRPRESRYQYSWAAYDRDDNCWPCQWGTVSGISGVKPGIGLAVLPAVVGHQSGSLRDDGKFANEDLKGDLGMGIACDISSELTAEVTINPDFSQVESDAAQIDVNTTFALFYPEKRPFFQEGSDLFNTYFDAVYTRSINNPLVAGKATWRKGSTSAAFLTARDENSIIILPFEESSEFVENGKSYSNIVRLRRDLGKQSHLGLVATDRRFDSGGSGTLCGIDGQMRLSESNALRLQVLATYTTEVDNLALTDSSFNVTRFDDGRYTAGLDGEEFWGHGMMVWLNRETKDYSVGGNYWDYSPTFRADCGFEPSNNGRQGSGWLQGIVRFDEKQVVENVTGRLDASRKWNYDGVRKDEWVMASSQVKFRTAQATVHSHYMWSNELFGGVEFDGIWRAHTCFQTMPSGFLGCGGYLNYGHRIARDDLVMGKQIDYGLWADVKPVDRLLISASYDYISSDDLKTDINLFSQSLLRCRLSLQLTREFSARLIVQYNDRNDTWETDPLLTYRLNPLSIFYIGSTRDYRDLQPDGNGLEGWTLTQRQYFVKLQYLFQL